MRSVAKRLQIDDIHAILWMDVALYDKFGTFYRSMMTRSQIGMQPLTTNQRAVLIRECLIQQQLFPGTDEHIVQKLYDHLGLPTKLARFVDEKLKEARADGEDI